MNNNKPLSGLTGGLLWNMNFENIDYIRDKELIIERIIESGMEKDEIIMWKLYSYEDIKNVAVNIENLHKDEITYMAFVLKINETDFRSYGKKMWYEK
ncbi:MAG: hypothetical protein FWD26_04600 [Treponema sp.]|nr:hypothetical protein [Treponema sp.]